MLKRILLSLTLLAVAGTVAVGATRALVSDSATLTANTFSVGTVDLQIARDDTSWGETVIGFSDTLYPGQDKNYYMWLKNNTSAVSLSLQGQAVNIVPSIGVTADQIDVTLTPVDSLGVPTAGTSAVGPYTLTQWNTIAAFPTEDNLGPGVGQRYKMNVKMNASVSSSGTISFDMLFTGTQVL